MHQSWFQGIQQANDLIIAEAHLFSRYVFKFFFIILWLWGSLWFDAGNKTHSVYLLLQNFKDCIIYFGVKINQNYYTGLG